jgi:hypothetical protein
MSLPGSNGSTKLRLGGRKGERIGAPLYHAPGRGLWDSDPRDPGSNRSTGTSGRPIRPLWQAPREDKPHFRMSRGASQPCRRPPLPQRLRGRPVGWVGNLLMPGPAPLIVSLCRARTRILAVRWRFLRSLRCPRVLADQALNDLSALDPGGHVDRLARLVQRRSLLPRLMGRCSL